MNPFSLYLRRAWLPIAFAAYIAAFYFSIDDMGLTASFYPKAVMAISLLLIVGVLMSDWRDVRALKADPQQPPSGRLFSGLRLAENRRPYYVVLWQLIFMLMISDLGFVIASAVFVPGTMATLGRRKPLELVIFGVAAAVVARFVIMGFLGVLLPEGPFGW